MMLSTQSIRRRMSENIVPFVDEPVQERGMSYGLGPAGYDIRIGKIDRRLQSDSYLINPGDFVLASALEWTKFPDDIVGEVKDKSTLARMGIALQTTVIEPGWYGHITLEISNHGLKPVRIYIGQPIAQLQFIQLDEPTERPYKGKYQNQEDRPVHAITDWNG